MQTSARERVDGDEMGVKGSASSRAWRPAGWRLGSSREVADAEGTPRRQRPRSESLSSQRDLYVCASKPTSRPGLLSQMLS